MIIEGRVQGVFFRARAYEKANQLGIKGWISNLPSGVEVEIIAEGEDEKIEEFLNWCSNGPRGARIDNIQADYEIPKNEFERFRIK